MKNWIEKNQGKLWFSIMLNAIVLVTLLLIYRPAYETNDDIAITTMVNGIKGVHDTHLVFIHRIVGYVLAALYAITPAVSWHAVLQYFLLFCGFTGVSFVFLNKFKNVSYLPVVLIFLYYFAFEGYIHIQFTKTAGILTVAGGTVLFWALFQKKVHKRAFVFGFILAIFGSFYRINQFMCEIGLLSALGIIFLFNLKGISKKEKSKRIITCIVSFGLLFIIGFGAYKLDMMEYDATEEWEYYMDYQNARSALLDYGFPNYEKNEAAYKAVGIDEVTYEMFDMWTHQDPEKITVEKMRSILELKEPKAINRTFFQKFARKMMNGIWDVNAFICCLILGVVWLFTGKKSFSSLLTLAYEAGVVVMIYIYLYYQGRCLRNRVDVGIWMAVAVLLLWLIAEGKQKLSKTVSITVLLAVLAVTSWQWKGDFRMNQKDVEKSYQEEKAVLTEIDTDDDHLYLTKTFTVSFAKAYGVFEGMPLGLGDNMYPLGGWTAQSEPYRAVLDRYGVVNPFRDIINNEKVYIVDIDIDLTMEYINNWYDENAEAVFVKNIGQHSVYKVISQGE